MGELCYGYQDVIRMTGISRTFDPGQIRDQTKIENIGFQTSYDSAVYVVACSRRSDSGERFAKKKGARKNKSEGGGGGGERGTAC